jgi:hypothetical protein
MSGRVGISGFFTRIGDNLKSAWNKLLISLHLRKAPVDSGSVDSNQL